MVNNIQVLRAIAAYLIVFYHLQPHVDLGYGADLWTHAPAAGVDIFFVISGFIMVFSTENRECSTVEFWKERVFRIVPLYWLVTFLMAGLVLIGFSPSGLHAWDLQSLLTSLFFLPTMRPDGVNDPIVTPGWSLIYEMFFYFLFGLGLLLRNQLRAVIALTVLFAGFWIAGHVIAPKSFVIAYYMKPITLEFAAGCFLGLIYARTRLFVIKSPVSAAGPLIVAGLAIIIASDIFAYRLFDRVQDMRPVIFGIPAVMIVTGALIMERSGMRYSGNFLLLQGAASYAVYLYHSVIMHSVVKVVSKAMPMDAVATKVFLAVLVVGTVGVVGTMIHLHVEKPIAKVLRRFVGRRREQAVAVPA